MADANASVGAGLRSVAQCLPGNVVDEMQLWTLGGLGLALVVVLAAQTIAAVSYTFFAVFPIMGRNYEAAVISAGFTGISLGATPTAIANMTAVTKLHNACARAFIILPLVSAFFIDIANALAIGFMVR